ncbi:right-handed parallel beta-helix repeat-containing protein [Salinispora arenicola]|uniref:right-handed parallel beta-helix repeat-containing protein n=1 Tax=Salinispora arenicola TaxID=168697 RepID=UPI002079C7CE|nr:right-handed parallel beta-helix repeat-containing protein [Salinispora arenicola]MCN0178130.1 right-handed parallel beta-helix repeat-containing protein [Salinispora arenicola]
MNHQHHTHELEPDRGRVRSRRRWWAVGLAGMTGLALTTTVGVAAIPAAGAVARTLTTTGDHPEKPSLGDHRGKSDGDKGEAKRETKPKGIPVPCDPDRLIAEINLANARGGATLDLAKKCAYTLTADIDGAGLPAITTPITLNGGKNTTITRAAAAEPFRILNVNVNGRLTLNHLTITGGQPAPGGQGGGILVNPGGGATINHSRVVRNISGNNGGGVANLGGSLEIRNSTVGHNTAAITGGGVVSAGKLVVDKSRFDANTASAAGGIGVSGVLRITRSEIVNHRAGTGGGMFIFAATGTISDTRFERNTTTDVGGAAIGGGPLQLTLSRVTIANNTATSGLGFGALFLQGGTALVEDSVIRDNIGTNGGGIRNLGTLTLIRTKVTGNQATGSGGGVFNEFIGRLALFATQITKNTAGSDGGGIVNQAGGIVDLNTATGTVVVRNRPNNCVNVIGCPG